MTVEIYYQQNLFHVVDFIKSNQNKIGETKEFVQDNAAV